MNKYKYPINNKINFELKKNNQLFKIEKRPKTVNRISKLAKIIYRDQLIVT